MVVMLMWVDLKSQEKMPVKNDDTKKSKFGFKYYH